MENDKENEEREKWNILKTFDYFLNKMETHVMESKNQHARMKSTMNLCEARESFLFLSSSKASYLGESWGVLNSPENMSFRKVVHRFVFFLEGGGGGGLLVAKCFPWDKKDR